MTVTPPEDPAAMPVQRLESPFGRRLLVRLVRRLQRRRPRGRTSVSDVGNAVQ